MSQHRDLDVAEALRRLDVPDHGPDFWAALEARLADENLASPVSAGRPDGDAEAEVVDIATSPAARRRLAEGNRTPMLAIVAAVAIVVALVVGAGLLGSPADEESQVDTATVPEAIDEAPTPTDPVPTEPGIDPEAAEDAAQDWLDRLFAGDVEGAYELLDDPSRARMSAEDFDQLGSGLFEGAAAFAQDGISRTVTSYDGPAGAFHVVTFSGDVEREGMVETASYPVVITSTGVHFVIDDAPEVELDPEYSAGSGTTLASPLVMVVGQDTDAWVSFDGGQPQPLTDRGRVEIDVEGSAGTGTHLVTVVAARGDLVTARAHTVVVP